MRWTGPLWSYIDVRDAAGACRLAIEANFSGHKPFNICAPNTIMNVPTTDLVRQYLPDVKARIPFAEANWSGYDPRKAKKLLSFTARHLFEAA